MHERTCRLGGCVPVLLFAAALGSTAFLKPSTNLLVCPLGLLLGMEGKSSVSSLAIVFSARTDVLSAAAVGAVDALFLSLHRADALETGQKAVGAAMCQAVVTL